MYRLYSVPGEGERSLSTPQLHSGVDTRGTSTRASSDPARLAAARGALRRRQPRPHQPPAQRWAPAVSGSQAGTCANRCARGAAHRGSRRIAPVATRQARGRPARRPPPSAGAPAADHAAALWQLCRRIGTHDDGRLPGGRLTRPLPPPAKGHGREAWCKQRSGTAGGRWGPRLPGQPASRLHPHALVRAAFANLDPDRRGLWVQHADTHAQSDTPRVRGRTVHRSPSIGARTGTPAGNTGSRKPPGREWCCCNWLLLTKMVLQCATSPA